MSPGLTKTLPWLLALGAGVGLVFVAKSAQATPSAGPLAPLPPPSPTDPKTLPAVIAYLRAHAGKDARSATPGVKAMETYEGTDPADVATRWVSARQSEGLTVAAPTWMATNAQAGSPPLVLAFDPKWTSAVTGVGLYVILPPM